MHTDTCHITYQVFILQISVNDCRQCIHMQQSHNNNAVVFGVTLIENSRNCLSPRKKWSCLFCLV